MRNQKLKIRLNSPLNQNPKNIYLHINLCKKKSNFLCFEVLQTQYVIQQRTNRHTY